MVILQSEIERLKYFIITRCQAQYSSNQVPITITQLLTVHLVGKTPFPELNFAVRTPAFLVGIKLD
jgi:hypothetical protein